MVNRQGVFVGDLILCQRDGVVPVSVLTDVMNILEVRAGYDASPDIPGGVIVCDTVRAPDLIGIDRQRHAVIKIVSAGIGLPFKTFAGIGPIAERRVVQSGQGLRYCTAAGGAGQRGCIGDLIPVTFVPYIVGIIVEVVSYFRSVRRRKIVFCAVVVSAGP